MFDFVPALHSTRRSALARLIVLLLAALTAGGVSAQTFPGKPIRLVVGSPPGALGDVLARLVAEKLTEATGQPTVVDNKAGASGLIAAEFVARAAGDGATLFVAPDNVFVVNPFIVAKIPYDATKDFRSIALLGKASLVLIANPKLGIKSMAELIKAAKANPMAINFGSGGTGHVTHVGVELIADRLGLKLTHVPYKGTSPAMLAVLGGEVGLMLTGIAGGMPQIKAGKVIPLAASGPVAKELFPTLPELKEFHRDLDISVWFGLFGPAAIPNDIADSLNGAMNKALQQPDVIKKFGAFGITPQPGPASALDALVKEDTARFGPLIKALNITME